MDDISGNQRKNSKLFETNNDNNEEIFKKMKYSLKILNLKKCKRNVYSNNCQHHLQHFILKGITHAHTKCYCFFIETQTKSLLDSEYFSELIGNNHLRLLENDIRFSLTF